MALFLEPVTRYWLSEDTSQHRISVGSSAYREREAKRMTTGSGRHGLEMKASHGAVSRQRLDLRFSLESMGQLSGLKVEPVRSQNLESSFPFLY